MHENATEHNRRRFKMALAFRGVTATEWAKEQGVTRGHLHHVLSGLRESQKLTDAVEAFVADAERDMAAGTARAA